MKLSRVLSSRKLMCLFFVLTSLLVQKLIGQFYVNFGFAYLARGISVELADMQALSLQHAAYFFNQATHYNDIPQAARRGLGFVALANENVQEAINIWRAGSYPAINLLRRGWQSESLRHWDEAMQWYALAAQLDFAQSVGDLAELYHRQQDYAAAIKLWREALSKYPQHPQRLRWWHGLSHSLLADEQWDLAKRTAEQGLLEYPDDPALILRLGQALYSTGKDNDAAIALIRRTITLDEDWAEAYAVLGGIMLREQQYNEAYFLYGMAVEHNPEVRWWKVMQGNAARAMHDLPLAITIYREVIEQDPRNDTAYYELAWAYYLNNQSELAIASIERALGLSSRPMRYYVRAGEIYEWAGFTEKALWAYQQAAQLSPKDEDIKSEVDRLERKLTND